MPDAANRNGGSLESRLRAAVDGEVRFDRFTRGLYAGDASIYRIQPTGVVFPRSAEDVRRTVEVAAEVGVPLTPRGGGTSMAGQAIGRGLIVDTSRHLDAVRELDPRARRALVEPGLVLDDLNRLLEPHGLCFPIDIATSSRATIGGMAGNNSAGARSIRYGHMVEQVRGIEAVLADGTRAWFGAEEGAGSAERGLERAMRSLYAREAEELARRVPRVPRHVAGYALHRLGRPGASLADLLVGSEGTLAFFTAVELRLHPLPARRALAVCRFASVRAALSAVPAFVRLEPTAVELVDRALLELAGSLPTFRDALPRLIGSESGSEDGDGLPGAVLLVEFSGDDPDPLEAGLDGLEAVADDAGCGARPLRAHERARQDEIWGLRKAGLNIAQSMVDPRKPIAFIEDCAIPLPRLPEWHDRLSAVIRRHETHAIWYAHASVGCLHVRPALDLSREDDAGRLRAIAEEAFAIARDLGGSHSGEHGDGIVRSEFIARMLGPRLAAAFGEVKSAFDPAGVLNPGRIVDPPRMDDPALLRRPPDADPSTGALDWSRWGGFARAVDMCNNNGACRKRDPGVMCPTYRVTRDERHATRGRANALRMALAGELGPDPWASPDLHEAMDLCIGCKGCKRECPTGVDMARMKIEFLDRRRASEGLGLRDRAFASVPRYAPWVSRIPGAPRLLALRERSPVLARLSESLLGIAAERPLPVWARRPFGREGRDRALLRAAAPGHVAASPPTATTGVPGAARSGETAAGVTLFVDTFTRYFEPENARAAVRVLRAAGARVRLPRTKGRPPCCGRTFLNAGLVEEARAELGRLLEAVEPALERGDAIVGLEPSCTLTLRDELPALVPGPGAERLAAAARLLPEWWVEAADAHLGPVAAGAVYVHAHCHEKAFGLEGSTTRALGKIPGLDVTAIASGCCGMAGSFGYEAEHLDTSRRIGEFELMPAVRAAAAGARIVANGFSCRHQIAHLGGVRAVHVARLLDEATQSGGDPSARSPRRSERDGTSVPSPGRDGATSS